MLPHSSGPSHTTPLRDSDFEASFRRTSDNLYLARVTRLFDNKTRYKKAISLRDAQAKIKALKMELGCSGNLTVPSKPSPK
jgi:hypothetical protein